MYTGAKLPSVLSGCQELFGTGTNNSPSVKGGGWEPRVRRWERPGVKPVASLCSHWAEQETESKLLKGEDM